MQTMALLSTRLRAATLNIRGMASRRRQYQVRRLLLESDLDLLAVQETKIDSESGTDSMVETFRDRYSVCVSHAVGNSAGCCLFLRNSVGIEVQSVFSCVSGRYVVADYMFGKKGFRTVCVYAPTKPKPRMKFFEELTKFFVCDRSLIVMGDFNCVFSNYDRSNKNAPGDPSAHFLETKLSENSLHDVTTFVTAQDDVKFTHFQGFSHARLDRIYVSSELASESYNYQVEPQAFSDHCLVSISLGAKVKRKAEFNWDLWKINTKLLEDSVFVESVRKRLYENYDRNCQSAGEAWERFKQDVKMMAIERAGKLHYLEKKEEKDLRSLLMELTKEETRTPGYFSEDIRNIKAKIEKLEVEKYKGAAIRARVERLLVGEQPTKRALADEKSYARKHEIRQIEYGGMMKMAQSDIKKAFTEYYTTLFSRKMPTRNGYETEFLKLLPALDNDETQSLEYPISRQEIEEAIDKLNSGKSPGPDGLNAAFYKMFKSEVTTLLHTVYAETYVKGCLPPSFSNGYTVLIPKSEEAEKLSKVTGYRPITLTNIDYKVFMKVLAKRLQSVMKNLVGPHQTCGIKGRSICTNIHVARSVLECCDAEHRNVAMLQIDLEKAFDRVSHDILFAVLEHVKVGSVVFEGIKMAYKNCSTNVIINKELTERINVNASVRQGCPMSPLLFALYLEPLCRKIIQSSRINGFVLEATEVKVLAYADDVAVFCIDQLSVTNTLSLTKEFCEVTGSSVNLDKCNGIWHDEWHETPRVYDNVLWSSTPTKYLGVPFDKYRENTMYWREKVEEMRAQTTAWAGRHASIFARATICNMFLFAKVWYVMQALFCTRANIQRFHRMFAVFVWQSSFERTKRSSLFRKLQGGGLGLPNLFVKQLVSRFLFLRDQCDPFIRTFIQVRLSSAMPNFIVSTRGVQRYAVSGYLREVVSSFRFLNARFTLDYLSQVTRKRLYCDVIELLCPEPMYRGLYRGAHTNNVLKRVKSMPVTGGVKTFFFKLHTQTLPVLTWMHEKGMYLPWGYECRLCKKPENVQHVFVDCWDAVFFWDVLQRTFHKDLPLTLDGIRYLDIKDDVIPYDVFFLLGLHAIWRSRMAVRNNDVDAMPVVNYFIENVCKLREVHAAQGCDDDVARIMNDLCVMKVHKC